MQRALTAAPGREGDSAHALSVGQQLVEQASQGSGGVALSFSSAALPVAELVLLVEGLARAQLRPGNALLVALM
ncbi:hypothetical protein HaLaN_29302, partial [Haematococcus lacustris]